MAAVTCQELRALFSARADDALEAEERTRLDAHLASCADCAREWRRFDATVALLRAVEPARAPTGFVDRVLAARPRPWYRRLARGLFLPWPVKLPLDAAAIVLVAGLAVMVFQRSPDLQQAARAPQPPAETPAAPRPSSPAESESGTQAPAEPASPSAPSVHDARRSQDVREAKEERAKQDTRADEVRRPARPTTESPSVGIVTPRPAPEVGSESARREIGRERAAPGAANQVEEPRPGARGEQRAAGVEALASRQAARAVAVDVEARLAAPDRDAAEREIRSAVARLGGIVTATPPSLQIVLPRSAWEDLARDLARLGTLTVVRRASELPPAVRLTLRLE